MSDAPQVLVAGHLTARRMTRADLAFVQRLLSHPALSTHKPAPYPSPPEVIEQSHTADLTHWQAHGFGRYVVVLVEEPIGLCGLTHKAGLEGLNLSYHLSPDHWGQGHATRLVRALVGMAATHLQGPIYGLVRPANLASARVLTKTGFTRAEELNLGGAPTFRYIREV